MALIKKIYCRQIIDSRANPTLETELILDNGIRTSASVPSGASVAKAEAVELRDENPQEFLGLGVLKAVENVNSKIAPKLIGQNISQLDKIDEMMIELDKTSNKSSLGANAILSVSTAACKAAAINEGLPLYLYIAKIAGLDSHNLTIPTPYFNVINGGQHGAGNNLEFQEFLIIPKSYKDYSSSLKIGVECYLHLKNLLKSIGAMYSIGDEGGFTPSLQSNLDAFELMIKAADRGGYQLGRDIFLGLDAAASTFYSRGSYHIKEFKNSYSSDEFINFYTELNQKYHLLILEDPLFEEGWNEWPKLASKVEKTTIIVGDDLLATNKERLKKAIDLKCCNGVIVKPNQIGTVSETIEFVKFAKTADLRIIVSHRSGETTDSFLADFAVGIGADYVKFGAPCRGERTIKYNRLLQIEEELKRL